MLLGTPGARILVVLAILLALCAQTVRAQESGPSLSLLKSAIEDAGASEPLSGKTSFTLSEALSIAFAKSPKLRSERARVSEVRGRVVGAQTYPYNPELGLSANTRSGPPDSSDKGIELSQEIEIAGQRGHRIATASAELEAARSGLLRAKRLLAAEVHLAFLDALVAEELREVARDESDLARNLLDLTERRVARGAATQLDVNVAAAEFGRASQVVGEAVADSAVARAAFAEVLGLDPAALPKAAASRGTTEPPPPLPELLELATKNRADLEALRQVEQAARARIRLARSEAWPNLRLGVFAGREEATFTLLGGGLTIPIPLFDRNQGGIAEARAAARRIEAERDMARLGVTREVVTAYKHYQAALASQEGLRARVLTTSEENMELMRRAYQAGKLSWVEVLVMRRTLFDARRVLVTTSAEVQRARITIDIAAGRMPVPDSE